MKANPNRGPGDWLPADEPEVDDVFIDEAREELEASADDPADVSEDDVLARAWELQREADKNSERDSLDARDAAAIDAWECGR